ncbi:DGQHR domain-containing protein DpdB [Burkholderia sp. GbtcB21]|uniref:DGQHR domain-containing protein DpdB n=1 Tax=Burkholderia sp. GbtcB21 TaxID=2824766 RepID=UPI001C2F8868|nr:DGQHR domain-containing protein DpdB [Burkholderia sp. GbtcB21]
MKSLKSSTTVVAPAVRTQQGETTVYLLFLPGGDVRRIADIRRIKRGEGTDLEGFQRKEIRDHVNEIAHYLDNGGTLFPNAIILALEPNMKFDSSRGSKATVTVGNVTLGRLHIPVRDEGQRSAWIVDGQQRSLALSKSSNNNLVVPVVAFETDSIHVQREQFILVNRAKPLPQRLIDELLPETQGIALPRDLTMRQLPSQLCNALNTHDRSPLRGMIQRASQTSDPERLISDTAILDMIKRSLGNPNGALADFKALGNQTGDASSMLQTLVDFWSAVKDTFPDAWGKPPSESRLMHSAGIAALGDLMDRIAARATSRKGQRIFFAKELGRISADCAWTEGRWELVDRGWDEIQNTPQDIKMLSQILVQLYAQRIIR